MDRNESWCLTRRLAHPSLQGDPIFNFFIRRAPNKNILGGAIMHFEGSLYVLEEFLLEIPDPPPLSLW